MKLGLGLFDRCLIRVCVWTSWKHAARGGAYGLVHRHEQHYSSEFMHDRAIRIH